MAGSEIPLLRESATFSSRLLEATARFADRRYHYHRRVNWSYRYGATFYAREAECFEEANSTIIGGAKCIIRHFVLVSYILVRAVVPFLIVSSKAFNSAQTVW